MVNKSAVRSPAIFAVEGSTHDGLGDKILHVLYRESNIFDPRNAIYEDVLEEKEMTVKEILKAFTAEDSSCVGKANLKFVSRIMTNTEAFAFVVNLFRNPVCIHGQLRWPALQKRSVL